MLDYRKAEIHLLQSWRKYADLAGLPDDVRAGMVREMAVLLSRGKGSEAELVTLDWLCARAGGSGDWARFLELVRGCTLDLWRLRAAPVAEGDDEELPAAWLEMGRIVRDIGGGMRGTWEVER